MSLPTTTIIDNENIRKKPDYNIKNIIQLWWVKQKVINTANDNDNENEQTKCNVKSMYILIQQEEIWENSEVVRDRGKQGQR